MKEKITRNRFPSSVEIVIAKHTGKKKSQCFPLSHKRKIVFLKYQSQCLISFWLGTITPNVSVTLFRCTATQQSNFESFYFCVLSFNLFDFQESPCHFSRSGLCRGKLPRESRSLPQSLAHPGTGSRICTPWRVLSDGPEFSSHISLPVSPPQYPQTPQVSRAIPGGGGEDTDQSHALARDQLRFLGTTTPRGREPSRGFFLGGLQRKPGSPGRVAGPGGPGARPGGAAAGAGPSARGAGGACDHAARGRARSAARRRRRGEQWRPWPPERRVRCRRCCGGCRCRGSAAGIALAPAARAGSPSPSSHFPSPGSRPGRQVSALPARGRSQTMGAAGGLLPFAGDPRARPPRRPGIPDLAPALG